MIECVLFDLDGVLMDATEWHYEVFNNALIEHALEPIKYEDHLKYYNGLPTKIKISILKESGVYIDNDTAQSISKCKQAYTAQYIEKYAKPSYEKIGLISELKECGMKLGVCTNSVRQTLDMLLAKGRLSEFFDVTYSNEDVKHQKPDPEMYITAMDFLGVKPENTLIIEDSPKGIKAAKDSGAHVLEVEGFEDVNRYNIMRKIAEINYNGLQILIPMAGKGTRFQRVGYTMPKPLIPIFGEPMIAKVIKNLDINGAVWLFVCLQDHIEKYDIADMLSNTCNTKAVVTTDGVTEGAACSAMLAQHTLDLNKPLIIANSDQYIDYDLYNLLIAGIGNDGAILTFKSDHPKWSYARTGADGYVTEVKEKTVISEHATVGIYLWNKAEYFVDSVNKMIEANDRYNNEFYIAPSYNYSIQSGKKYKIHEIRRQCMWGLGTPEDLIKFVDHHE